jgi:hypothetical protein
MRIRSRWFVLAVATGAAAIAINLHAQQGPDTQSAASTAKEVTLIGCLVRTDTSARRPGTTGSTPPGESERQANAGFALKHAAAAAKPAAGAVDTHSSAEVSVAATGKVDLAAHVNHQVEIKGHMGKGSAQRTGDTDFQVTSIRTVSENCQPARE